jgi:hypothetical protein
MGCYSELEIQILLESISFGGVDACYFSPRQLEILPISNTQNLFPPRSIKVSMARIWFAKLLQLHIVVLKSDIA